MYRAPGMPSRKWSWSGPSAAIALGSMFTGFNPRPPNSAQSSGLGGGEGTCPSGPSPPAAPPFTQASRPHPLPSLLPPPCAVSSFRALHPFRHNRPGGCQVRGRPGEPPAAQPRGDRISAHTATSVRIPPSTAAFPPAAAPGGPPGCADQDCIRPAPRQDH